MKKTVRILDTVYNIEQRTEEDDRRLEGLGGYCEVYSKLIVIRNDRDNDNKPPEAMIKQILRHEIVHAFLFESGLWNDSNESETWATNEEMVDWIAIQGLKIYKAWEEAEAV